MDWGWGNPGIGVPYVPAGTPNDWGYGSPTPSFAWTPELADAGFGAAASIIAPVVKAAEVGAWPDDGGVFIVLLAAWAHPGPYYVRLKKGATLYPADDNCYSGVVGQRDKCTPDGAMTSLRFVLPPAPPDTYDIRLRFGVETEVIIPSAIVIQNRMRSESVYRMRLRLPKNYLTGARQLRAEPTLPVASEWPHGNLDALLHAAGEMFRETSGVPMTRLTAPLVLTDAVANVESTLELPSSGAVYIHGARHTYTGKTASTLTGLVAAVARVLTIPAGMEVTLDSRAVQPA